MEDGGQRAKREKERGGERGSIRRRGAVYTTFIRIGFIYGKKGGKKRKRREGRRKMFAPSALTFPSPFFRAWGDPWGKKVVKREREGGGITIAPCDPLHHLAHTGGEGKKRDLGEKKGERKKTRRTAGGLSVISSRKLDKLKGGKKKKGGSKKRKKEGGKRAADCLIFHY